MIKTSGKKAKYEGGYQRDTAEGKLRYDLIPPELLKRLAQHYTKGAELYGDSNWKLASDQKGRDRFFQSAYRHFMQWVEGQEDEDHAIACVWNIFAHEWHKRHKVDNSD